MTKEVHPSWEELRGYADEIADYFDDIDYVACIARGGLPIGVYLTHRLDAEFRLIHASHYREKERKNLVNVKGVHLDGITGDDTVLLFDDVVETGKTMGEVKKDMRLFKPVPYDLNTASLHAKPDANLYPDYWAVETDKWIVYPWETGHELDQ